MGGVESESFKWKKNILSPLFFWTQILLSFLKYNMKAGAKYYYVQKKHKKYKLRMMPPNLPGVKSCSPRIMSCFFCVKAQKRKNRNNFNVIHFFCCLLKGQFEAKIACDKKSAVKRKKFKRWGLSGWGMIKLGRKGKDSESSECLFKGFPNF